MKEQELNKFIEIPFGAKDSELQEWEYTIPEGMTAKIKDGKIIIKRKPESASVLRCRDCKHMKTGKKCMRNQFWISCYCEEKPKTIKGETKYFYAVNLSDKACVKFENKCHGLQEEV